MFICLLLGENYFVIENHQFIFYIDLYSTDKNKTGASQVLNVMLFFFVSDPPRIDPLLPVRAQIPGETLVLNCTARGGPEPVITWYKDRKFLQIPSQDQLFI